MKEEGSSYRSQTDRGRDRWDQRRTPEREQWRPSGTEERNRNRGRDDSRGRSQSRGRQDGGGNQGDN